SPAYLYLERCIAIIIRASAAFFLKRIAEERRHFLQHGDQRPNQGGKRGFASAKACSIVTVAAISSGTARNAPTGPHSHVQNATERKTANGFTSRRRAMKYGVTT